jgi:hypothetical protein
MGEQGERSEGIWLAQPDCSNLGNNCGNNHAQICPFLPFGESGKSLISLRFAFLVVICWL